jgi:hypothetical protein
LISYCHHYVATYVNIVIFYCHRHVNIVIIIVIAMVIIIYQHDQLLSLSPSPSPLTTTIVISMIIVMITSVIAIISHYYHHCYYRHCYYRHRPLALPLALPLPRVLVLPVPPIGDVVLDVIDPALRCPAPWWCCRVTSWVMLLRASPVRCHGGVMGGDALPVRPARSVFFRRGLLSCARTFLC